MAIAKKYNLIQTVYDTIGTDTFYPYRVETVGAYNYYYNRAGTLVNKRGVWQIDLPGQGEWVTEISQFSCKYSISWEVAGTVKVPVLDAWPFKKKPVAISTNGMIAYNVTHTEAINKTPDEQWFLIFSDSQIMRISEWNAKSLAEQAAYLGETAPEIKNEEKPQTDPDNDSTSDATGAATAAQKDPAKTTGKTAMYILIVLGTLLVGVSLWAFQRNRKQKHPDAVIQTSLRP